MKKFLKRLFLISFVFFIMSHWITKYVDSGYPLNFITTIYAMPLEFWEGRNNIKILTYATTQKGVAELLRSSPKDPQHLSEEGVPPSYVVIRLKNGCSWSKWGNIKCYCSGFPYPLVTFILLGFRTPYYHDIIFPYPVPIDSQIEKNYTIKTRWKNFWGM